MAVRECKCHFHTFLCEVNLVNSVLDVLHISIHVKPHCVIKSFPFIHPLTHTQTHKHIQSKPNVKLHYFIANL